MNRFDIVKFRTLTNVYAQALDEYVKQRALVGWTLAIDDDWIRVYPEMQDIINTLLQDAKAVDEFAPMPRSALRVPRLPSRMRLRPTSARRKGSPRPRRRFRQNSAKV